jgi:hypothetical protein
MVYMTTKSNTSSTASAKQLSFISSLFSEAKAGFEQADAVLVDVLTPKIASIQPTLIAVIGKQEVDKVDASFAIGVLIAVRDALFAALAPPLPAGLAALNPERVIVNKFGAACALCGARVETGQGHAVFAPWLKTIKIASWKTICAECAETDARQLGW